MNREADMVRRKAARMDKTQVHAELNRIDRGALVAQSESARKRYATRRIIFQERLNELKGFPRA